LDLALVEILSYNDPSEAHLTTVSSTEDKESHLISLIQWSDKLGSGLLTEEIREQMKSVDIESHMFEYAAKTHELQHRLSASADRIKYLDEDRNAAITKLTASDERFHALQRQYQELLANNWTQSTNKNESDDALLSLMNTNKVRDEEILACKKQIETDLASQALEQNQMESMTDRALRAEAEANDLREQMKLLEKQIDELKSKDTNGETPNQELTSVTHLNKRLQEHTIYLQDRLEQVRYEKHKLGERFTDRIRCIDESISAQIKAQYDINVLLIRTNQQLRDQLVEANTTVTLCEEQVKGMIEQQIRDSDQINRQYTVLETTRKREEDTRIEFMHTLYRTSKNEKVQEEHDKESKQMKITLQKKDEEIAILRKKLEQAKGNRFFENEEGELIETVTTTESPTSSSGTHSEGETVTKRSNTKSLALFSRAKQRALLPIPPQVRRTSLENSHNPNASPSSPPQPNTPQTPVLVTPPSPVVEKVTSPVVQVTPSLGTTLGPPPLSPSGKVRSRSQSTLATSTPLMSPNTPTTQPSLLLPGLGAGPSALRKSSSNINSPQLPPQQPVAFNQLLEEMRLKKLQREKQNTEEKK
jgi:myosin heavy subunit